MEAVNVVTGTAVPLDRSDVDTDQIIPSDWLKRVERTGFGGACSRSGATTGTSCSTTSSTPGRRSSWPGPNFGTGSSREHAVWAILDYGFQAVISPRFADIFRNNSTKNGLVPVQVDAAVGEALLRAVEADPTLEITIDVERRTVAAPAVGIEAPFPLDEATRHRLLKGLDDIGLSLQHVDRDRRLRDHPPRLATVSPCLTSPFWLHLPAVSRGAVQPERGESWLSAWMWWSWGPGWRAGRRATAPGGRPDRRRARGQGPGRRPHAERHHRRGHRRGRWPVGRSDPGPDQRPHRRARPRAVPDLRRGPDGRRAARRQGQTLLRRHAAVQPAGPGRPPPRPSGPWTSWSRPSTWTPRGTPPTRRPSTP